MNCRHCGHQNPPENRFCGMCGHLLLPARQAEPVGQPAAPPVRQAAPPPPRQSPDAPLTGPSFLGLSSEPDAPAAESYSYLFQDEPKRSHTGLYVFLLLLVIAGGVLYARWQPIRNLVMSTVAARLHPAPPAPSQPPSAAPPAAGEQATISVAPHQPEQTGQSAPPQDAAADPNTTDASDKPAPAEAAKATEPESKTEPDAAASNETAKSAVARAPKPQSPPGEALVNSGEKYLYGQGVRKNCDQAVRYFRAAAEQQNPRALAHLGTMYAIGECVPMDRAVAYSWFSRALAGDRGNRSLERNLAMLWREMSPDERQRAGAR